MCTDVHFLRRFLEVCLPYKSFLTIFSTYFAFFTLVEHPSIDGNTQFQEKFERKCLYFMDYLKIFILYQSVWNILLSLLNSEININLSKLTNFKVIISNWNFIIQLIKIFYQNTELYQKEILILHKSFRGKGREKISTHDDLILPLIH